METNEVAYEALRRLYDGDREPFLTLAVAKRKKGWDDDYHFVACLRAAKKMLEAQKGGRIVTSLSENGMNHTAINLSLDEHSNRLARRKLEFNPHAASVFLKKRFVEALFHTVLPKFEDLVDKLESTHSKLPDRVVKILASSPTLLQLTKNPLFISKQYIYNEELKSTLRADELLRESVMFILNAVESKYPSSADLLKKRIEPLCERVHQTIPSVDSTTDDQTATDYLIDIRGHIIEYSLSLYDEEMRLALDQSNIRM